MLFLVYIYFRRVWCTSIRGWSQRFRSFGRNILNMNLIKNTIAHSSKLMLHDIQGMKCRKHEWIIPSQYLRVRTYQNKQLIIYNDFNIQFWMNDLMSIIISNNVLYNVMIHVFRLEYQNLNIRLQNIFFLTNQGGVVSCQRKV